MFDHRTHDFENAFPRRTPKGGVAPSRYELAHHQNRLKRRATFEAETRERRRRNAYGRKDASITILGRVVHCVARVLYACYPYRRQQLK